MKRIVPLLLLCLTTGAKAQKPVLNHVAFYVRNLTKSTAFYQTVIGLDTIPEPFRDGKHTWFAIGPKSHLHLIEGATAPLPHPKNSHLCFSVPSVDVFVKRLHQAAVAFEDWAGNRGSITLRVDGVKQVYFQDPDGYWIEVNDARD